MVIKYLKRIACGVWVLLLAAPVSGQVSFELLDSPGQQRWADFSLSRDGRNMGCLLGGEVYWWTVTEGFRFLNVGSSTPGGVGMSAAGNALIASRTTDSGTAPAIWYRDGSFTELGVPASDCRDEHLTDLGYDLNADGTIAVGRADSCQIEKAFIWSHQAGSHSLAGAARADSRSMAVSADGQVVVGFCEHPTEGYRRPVVWQNGTGPHLFLGHERVGEALNISLNGKTVVGQAEMGSVNLQAFCWTVGREPIALGNLSGRATDSSLASAVSDDGKVVGWSGDELFGDQEAFIWTAEVGMRSLAHLARTAGADLPAGMRLTSALDISGDGTTVVGVGRDEDWKLRYWRLRLDDSMSPVPVVKSALPADEATEPVLRDTLGIGRADMLHPFPFGKRRY